MAGPREKWPARSKATPVAITAGGRRPARSHRPVDRFVPGLSSSLSSSRSPETPPSRAVPNPGPPLVIRLRVPHAGNPGAFAIQAQPTIPPALVNVNSTTVLRPFSTAANLTTNSQSLSTATNSNANLQSVSTAANPATFVPSFSIATNSIANFQSVATTANSITTIQSVSTAANPTTNATTNFQANNAATDLQVSTKIATGPLTEFNLFPKLPPELRHMIWKYFLPAGPRIITIQFDNDKRKHTYRFLATNAFPLLLRVCRDSRQVFTLRYKQYAFNHPRCKNACYFNFEQDILAFEVLSAHGQRSTWLSHLTVTRDIKHVKNLAFSHVELWKELNGEEKRYRPLPLPTFMHFQNLQKVLVVNIVRHRSHCTFCYSGVVPPKDKEMFDELEERVDNLKNVFEEGKMYCFMFGKEWEPPEWEYLPICQYGSWRGKYLRQLNEAALIKDIADNPAGDAMEGVTQVNEVAAEAAGAEVQERSIDDLFQELFEEPMETTAQPEESGSLGSATDDDTVRGSETSASETMSMMEMDGESVNTTSSSEDGSVMATEMEDMSDGV